MFGRVGLCGNFGFFRCILSFCSLFAVLFCFFVCSGHFFVVFILCFLRVIDTVCDLVSNVIPNRFCLFGLMFGGLIHVLFLFPFRRLFGFVFFGLRRGLRRLLLGRFGLLRALLGLPVRIFGSRFTLYLFRLRLWCFFGACISGNSRRGISHCGNSRRGISRCGIAIADVNAALLVRIEVFNQTFSLFFFSAFRLCGALLADKFAFMAFCRLERIADVCFEDARFIQQFLCCGLDPFCVV